MATDFLISFDDLKAGSAAVKRLVQAFTRAGATVASSDIDPKTRRTSGVNYRQVLITFTDNQKVLLGVKTTGDIFEVRVNGAALAIKNQDNQIKAVGEIAKALDAGRAKFQAKMARTKVALPKGITTAAPKMEQRLQEAETALDAEIAAVKAKITDLRAELGEPVMDGVSREKDIFWVLKEEYGVIPSNAPVVVILWAAGRVWANGGDWKSQLDKLNKERERQGKPIAYSSDVVKIDRDETMDSTHTAAGETFNGGEWDTLYQMSKAGKLEDGDVPSKASRDSLVKRGFVERGEGFNWLTDKGKEIAAVLDSVGSPFDPKTDRWVSTQNGSKLLIRGGEVIGGAGGKLNSTAAKRTIPESGVEMVRAARAILREKPHTVASFAKEAGVTNKKAKTILESMAAVGILYDPTQNGRIDWSDDMKFHMAKAAYDSASSAELDAKAASVLDAVDVPCNSFDDVGVVEAQAIAARIAAGDTLDDADLSHARATLLVALDTVETNHPINLAEGNLEQAELEEKAAESFRSAIKMLESREPLAA